MNKLFYMIFFFNSLSPQSQPINLTGLCLTYNDIALFTIPEKECLKHLKHSPLVEKIKLHNHELYNYIRANCLWHYKIPFCAMQADHDSSYVPYRFSLWQLAPKKGKGSCVLLLDTGVAAFEHVGIKKHPDITYINFNPLVNYNCCFTGLRDFMKYYATFLRPDVVCNEQDIIAYILEYCSTGKTDLLQASLKKYGKKELFDKQNMTAYGKEVMSCLTTGRRGIKPYGSTRFFSATVLTYPNNYATLCELLPVAYNNGIDKKSYYTASHGTHIYGLINADSSQSGNRIYGIAPEAQTIMLTIGNGVSNAETMLFALKKARDFNPDVINISLKFEQSWHNDIGDLIQNELKNFEYIIGASGNATSQEHVDHLPFPAAHSNVISVGAYFFDGKQYSICPFSHYEKNKGPHFVAPGFNILSTTIPTQEGDYLFLSGTSMATAIVSGFFALMLAEFKDYFNREQLLKVCSYSAKRLGSDRSWYEKTKHGALDMKTALFLLHVCKRLKKQRCFMKEKFEAYLHAISFILKSIEDNPATFKLTSNLDEMISLVVAFINKAMSTLKYNNNLIDQVRLILG